MNDPHGALWPGRWIRKATYVCENRHVIRSTAFRPFAPDRCSQCHTALYFVDANVPAQNDDRGWRELLARVQR